MTKRDNSIHLQDFPDVNFIKPEEKLIKDIDFVRLVCSAALSIRDQKNLRVRLPLKKLTVIGKNSAQILDFKSIIADEVNVKNIEIEQNISDLAELKLQINFKKIGAKFGPKVKEIMAAVKKGDFEKISESAVSVAGIILSGDDFSLNLIPKKQSEKEVIVALPDNSCLICLDIEITSELEEEGIARDIVRAVQQARREADLDVSNRINLGVFSSNPKILKVAKSHQEYIKEQVLGEAMTGFDNEEECKNSAKFFTKTKIEDGDLAISITEI